MCMLPKYTYWTHVLGMWRNYVFKWQQSLFVFVVNICICSYLRSYMNFLREDRRASQPSTYNLHSCIMWIVDFKPVYDMLLCVPSTIIVWQHLLEHSFCFCFCPNRALFIVCFHASSIILFCMLPFVWHLHYVGIILFFFFMCSVCVCAVLLPSFVCLPFLLLVCVLSRTGQDRQLPDSGTLWVTFILPVVALGNSCIILWNIVWDKTWNKTWTFPTIPTDKLVLNPQLVGVVRHSSMPTRLLVCVSCVVPDI